MDSVIRIGEPAPNFTLPDLEGKQHSLQDYRGIVVVLNFWSAECPWSARTDEKLRDLLAEWDEDVLLISIAPNANEPLEMLKSVAAERGLDIVLHDVGQHVASLYGAQTTPQLFLIDDQGILRYQGAFDDTSFRQRNATKYYLQEALEAVMEGEEPADPETLPYGCAIVRYAP